MGGIKRAVSNLEAGKKGRERELLFGGIYFLAA